MTLVVSCSSGCYTVSIPTYILVPDMYSIVYCSLIFSDQNLCIKATSCVQCFPFNALVTDSAEL